MIEWTNLIGWWIDHLLIILALAIVSVVDVPGVFLSIDLVHKFGYRGPLGWWDQIDLKT